MVRTQGGWCGDMDRKIKGKVDQGKGESGGGRRYGWERTYDLIVADYGHDAERLHTQFFDLSRCERWVISLVTKDYIGMDLCIEPGNITDWTGAVERGLRLTGRVIGAGSTFGILAIAVDVHVGILIATCRAVEEDRAFDVKAVGETGPAGLAIAKTTGSNVATFCGL